MGHLRQQGTGNPERNPLFNPQASEPRKDLFTLRVCEAPARELDVSLHASAAVADYFRALIGKADREMFYVVHLDCRNNALKIELHTVGDVDTSAVYPRQVMRSALLFNASSLIFCHNHPSGDLTPSVCDKDITHDLKAAADTLGIKVLDHVIVGPSPAFYSFADQGTLEA